MLSFSARDSLLLPSSLHTRVRVRCTLAYGGRGGHFSGVVIRTAIVTAFPSSSNMPFGYSWRESLGLCFPSPASNSSFPGLDNAIAFLDRLCHVMGLARSSNPTFHVSDADELGLPLVRRRILLRSVFSFALCDSSISSPCSAA